MNPYVETLFNLQRLSPTRGVDGTIVTPAAAKLRAQVPPPVLAHFDRLIAQGRKGVAEVRHGVCSACHLRLPAAVTATGATEEDLLLCENCGAYLRFSEGTSVPAKLPVASRLARGRETATAGVTK